MCLGIYLWSDTKIMSAWRIITSKVFVPMTSLFEFDIIFKNKTNKN